MSKKDKPFVVQHSVPTGVVATRWWWVRHAPVREDNGCIYGQEDIGCDTSDRVVFEAVGKILPRNAVWYASNLKRTHQTADAIWSAGFPKAAIGLALGNQPERGLAFTIDNCSVTRLDHLASSGHSGWRVPMVNQQPWIADASHNAMHQPAGPEIATASKL